MGNAPDDSGQSAGSDADAGQAGLLRWKHLLHLAKLFCCMHPRILDLPIAWRIREERLFSVILYEMRMESGGWIMKIWTEKSKKIISTAQFSVPHIIPVEEYGKEKR